jgi:hypothetical protein
VTSLKDIQSLIADIDSILPKADAARLPWSKPGDAAKERLVLERVRSYLVSQQQNFIATPQQPLAQPPTQQQAVQQLVQAVTREMDFLRADLIGSLQADIQALRQKRESLVEEIRLLEQKRQQIGSFKQHSTTQQQIISEFSQELINRCTESLKHQLAQILANFEARVANAESMARSMDAVAAEEFMQSRWEGAIAPVPSHRDWIAGEMPSQDYTEQLRTLQEHSDRMLATLDASQRAIFEALQRDLQSYQESLSKGLEKMHSLGTQGEMLFTALVNRWQQLEHQASTSFSPSAQLGTPANPTEAGTGQTTPETLLPSDALIGTQPSTPSLPKSPYDAAFKERSAGLNPSPELQTPLQPPQTVEPLATEQESASRETINPISTHEQEAMPNATTSPLTPQANAPEAATSLPNLSEPSPQDSFLENLNSEYWEAIEGIDSENLDFNLDDNDGIDTFIQLDIDESAAEPDSVQQVSLPSIEQTTIPSRSDSQDTDFLLNWLNEKLQEVSDSAANTPTGESEATGLGVSEVAADLNLSADRRRQEIDELYQNLFGTDSLSNAAKLDESDSPVGVDSDVSASILDSEGFQLPGDERTVNADSVTPLSSQIENDLFEELFDREVVAMPEVLLDPQEHPAVEATQAQPRAQGAGQFAESWEVLFFEDSAPQSASQTDVERGAQPSSSASDPLSNWESSRKQESIEIITALTDLFEEMGLNSSPAAPEGNSMPTPTQQQSESQTSGTQPEASSVEDNYIPASPDEDLLATAPKKSDPEVEICLNPNTIHQLQQDLHSFEKSLDQRQEEQRLPGNYFEGSTVAPDAERLNQQHQQFPMSEELLAEDWEELVRLRGLTREQDFAVASTENESLENSSATAPETVESDFDPDLFPQEALELDRENAVNASADVSEQLHISGEPLVFEDENFVEMQWDEPTDSSTEEAIVEQDASASIASSELEFGSDFFSGEALNSEPETEVSAALPETLNPQVQDDSSDSTSDTTLPPDPSL